MEHYGTRHASGREWAQICGNFPLNIVEKGAEHIDLCGAIFPPLVAFKLTLAWRVSLEFVISAIFCVTIRDAVQSQNSKG